MLAQRELWRTLPGQRGFELLLRVLKAAIWRRIPRASRNALASRLTPALARHAQDSQAAEPIYVVGYFASTCGVGEGARLTAEALWQAGYDVHMVDATHIAIPEEGDRENHARKVLEKGPGTLLLHFNPEPLFLLLPMIGLARLRGKRIIGYWAWEFSSPRPSWAKAIDYVDEVWTPSAFVAGAARQITTKPVRVVPHPVAVLAPGSNRRERFGIPDEVFTVLSVFSFSSSMARKNPGASVRAFRNAFGDDPRALLILKASNAARFPDALRRLEEEIGGAANIRILQSNLDSAAIRDLVASADLLLSLHRAEGFGLVLAEAMLAGVPVVATNWSGNLEFMDGSSAGLVSARMVLPEDPDAFDWPDDDRWAEADIIEASSWLRRIADDAGLRGRLAGRARKMAEERLGLEAFRANIAESFPDALASQPIQRIAS